MGRKKEREFYEKVFPELRKQREDRERFSRVGSRIKSDADLEEIMDGLQEQEVCYIFCQFRCFPFRQIGLSLCLHRKYFQSKGRCQWNTDYVLILFTPAIYAYYLMFYRVL